MRMGLRIAMESNAMNDNYSFWKLLKDVEKNPDVRLLQNYSQHRGNNSFQHSHNVAVYSFYLAEKWKWEIDPENLVKGAMLHDYYLYDFKEEGLSAYQHGIWHPKAALRNAKACFEINETVENIIVSHMWPFPFSARPRSREAFLVCVADKFCAYHEMINGMRRIEEKLGIQAI